MRKAACRAALCAGAVPLAACHEAGILDPHGPVSGAERLILLNSTAIMLVVVIPVILMTLVFAWWYRASNRRAVYLPDWAYSGQIELVVWAIPAMVVILLSGVAWIGAHELDPGAPLKSSAKPLRIEVVSLDWKWLFIYPDQHIALVNQLEVPAGVPLEFVLTSATVMNAFFVPQLGTLIYTMPGMTTHLNLLADQAGSYPGFSANFSGDGFSDMRFIVHAMPSAEFGAWLAQTRGRGTTLDDAGYAQLALAAGDNTPRSFGGVDSGLFEHIVMRSAPMAAAAKEN